MTENNNSKNKEEICPKKLRTFEKETREFIAEDMNAKNLMIVVEESNFSLERDHELEEYNREHNNLKRIYFGYKGIYYIKKQLTTPENQMRTSEIISDHTVHLIDFIDRWLAKQGYKVDEGESNMSIGEDLELKMHVLRIGCYFYKL